MSSTTAVHDSHDDHPTGIKRWLTTTNHKDIGTMYLTFSLIMFLIGGAMDVMMLPSPQWFSITDLAGAYFPMAWLGYKFAEGKTNA